MEENGDSKETIVTTGDAFVMEVKTRSCFAKVMRKGELNGIEVETSERSLKTLIKQNSEHSIELLG